MTQCAICNLIKAEWLMKCRYALLGELATAVCSRKKICDVCYKRLNPEGLERMEMQEDEEGQQALKWYSQHQEQQYAMRGQNIHMDNKYLEGPMIVHFRKIRRK